jgi:hypothetical protein
MNGAPAAFPKLPMMARFIGRRRIEIQEKMPLEKRGASD